VLVIRLPILSLVAALLALAGPPPAPAPPDLAHRFLHDTMGFSTGDVAGVDAGRAIARQMKTLEAVDVNIFGAVRINGSIDAFLRQITDIDALERKLGITQVGKFHEPPLLADLDGLTLEQADVDALADCRAGDCGLQLPAKALARLRTDVNWQGPDVKPQVDRLFRQLMFEELQTYRSGGSAGLGDYADREQALNRATEFRLLAARGDLPVELPELTYYIRSYPKGFLPGASDFFYWNKGEFGLKPTVRLNHVTIYPITGPGRPDGLRYVVATSQIYANHYFSATLELRSVMDDASASGKRFYLFYTTKSRVSGLTGGFMSMLIRPMVKSRARSGMERYLDVTKRVIEAGLP
jgi:hypothetical protein